MIVRKAKGSNKPLLFLLTVSKGYIPPYGLETLRNYYDPYVALGDGDPSIKHIVETCESLPVHSGETEVNT